MLYGWERVTPEAQLQLIRSPSLTPLASHQLYLQIKKPKTQKLCLSSAPLICICVTDLCLSHCWRITWRVAGSLICIGSSFSWHDSQALLPDPCEHPHASAHIHSSSGAPPPATVIVAWKRVSHFRGEDNSQKFHSVKAHHKFSSNRPQPCQAELKKIKTSVSSGRMIEPKTGTGRLTYLPHIHLSVFMGAQVVSVTALPHLGDSEKRHCYQCRGRRSMVVLD